eukprot:g1616.t1
MFVMCYGCLLAGVAVHRPLGQAGPRRCSRKSGAGGNNDDDDDDDNEETGLEHEIRVWWLYTMDGAFGIGILVECTQLIVYGAAGTLLDNSCQQLAQVGTGLGFYLLYICGNAAFLFALRRRSAALVRAFVAANVAFAFALVVLLVASLWYVSTHSGGATIAGDITPLRILEWVVRGAAVLFAVAAAIVETRLWNAYGPAAVAGGAAMREPSIQHASGDGPAMLGRGPDGHKYSGGGGGGIVGCCCRSKKNSSCCRWVTLTPVVSVLVSTLVIGVLTCCVLFDGAPFWEALG